MSTGASHLVSKPELMEKIIRWSMILSVLEEHEERIQQEAILKVGSLLVPSSFLLEKIAQRQSNPGVAASSTSEAQDAWDLGDR